MAGPTIVSEGIDRRLRSLVRHSLPTLLATTALGVVAAHAADGSWTGAATSEWTTGANWTSNPAVPDGVATFSTTGPTSVTTSAPVSIGQVIFTGTPNAPAYTITTGSTFSVNGAGIFNNSTNTQTFSVGAGMAFNNASSASAGSHVATYNVGAAGAMSFNGSSTAGRALIDNSGTLTFNSSATAASSTITTENNGTTSFTGTSSGGSARFVTNAGGAVDISGLTSSGTTAGSIEGAGNYVLGAKTLTTGSLNTSTQVDGVISGVGGSLTKVGTGTLTLTNLNSYSGATTVSSGTLALSGVGGMFNSSVVTVNATLDTTAASTQTVITTLAGSGIVQMGGTYGLFIYNGSTEFAGTIQSTGLAGIEIAGGTQTLSGANTYTNVTQIDGLATLALKGGGSIANSLYVAFAGAGATLDISQTTSGTSVTQLFSFGTTGVVALGSKTLTITGNSGTAFGGVIQDGGIAGGSGGNLLIANGGVQQLYGTNTYTGSTTIASGGELDLVNLAGSDGSIATSRSVIANGVFDITNLSTGTSIKSLAGTDPTALVHLGGNTLTITNANGTFAGAIDGAGGGLTLAGGTEILTNANTYTGATTVNGGTLVVNGSISSASTVNAGGTLAGTGTVGNVTVAGGTLAPGNPGAGGTLAINGSLSFTAASTYLVQISSSAASLASVTGAATLGGATVSANFLSGTVQKQSKILSATGGLGGSTFNPAVVSNLSSIKATLGYDANNVFLNIGINFTPGSGGGLTINQQNVANTLTNFFNTTGGLPVAFAALSPSGLTAASGELGTGIIQSAINADGQFLNLMLDPTVAGRSSGFTKAGSVAQFADSGEVDAYASMRPATASEREAFAMATKAPLFSQPINRWSVWTAGYGGSAQVGGNALVGSQDLTARAWGGATGADYRLSIDTLVGFSLGGGGLNYSLANAMGTGSADLFQAGIYGRHNFGPAYIAAALAYGWHDVTTNRTVAPGGFDQLQGRFKADTFSARFEGGYRFTTPLIGITPYAAAQVTNFNLPNYSEVSLNGGGLFALNYAAQSLTDTRSELGLRTDRSYAMQNGVLTLRGRAAWAHDYNPSRAVTALFQTLPGTSFVVNGARVDADSALVSASAEMKWLNGFSIAGTFDGEFSGNVTSYSGKGVFKYSW